MALLGAGGAVGLAAVDVVAPADVVAVKQVGEVGQRNGGVGRALNAAWLWMPFPRAVVQLIGDVSLHLADHADTP